MEGPRSESGRTKQPGLAMAVRVALPQLPGARPCVVEYMSSTGRGLVAGLSVVERPGVLWIGETILQAAGRIPREPWRY